MAQSWRLKTVEIDNTEKATTSTPIVGATVIVSPKGPNKFVRFNKGDTQGILDTFGYPSKDYPSIQDALDIITKCSMYMASPYDVTSGKYGGIFVTSTGSIPFPTGVSTKDGESLTYDSVTYNDVIIAKATTLTYTYKIKNIDKYIHTPNNTLTLKVGTTSLTLGFSESDNIVTITDSTSPNSFLDAGCTLNLNPESSDYGKLSLKFKSNTLTDGDLITIGYSLNLSDTYFVLFDKNMQEDDLSIRVNKPYDDEDIFEINVVRENPVTHEYVDVPNSPFLVGLSPTSKDTYGDNIYINNIFGDNQQLFDAYVNTTTVNDFTRDSSYVGLAGGERGDAPNSTEIAKIYEQLNDTSRFQIKFAFDGTCGASDNNPVTIVKEFETLRVNYQKRCRFLYCTPDVSGRTIVDTTNEGASTYTYGITNNRGMYEYCLNWGTHIDIYQGNNFKCSNMGLIAGRLVDALNAGTGCPAWIDENGVGGILGSSVLKLSQEVTDEDTLEELDNLNFNAVVNDFTYGVMIVGWRTRQVKKTVYSNIPQSSLADTIIELIVKEVLPSRIGKLIDEASYSVVRTSVNNIMSTYSNFLEDYYVWCDSDNNTAETREKEQLILTVGVVFKNYARQCIFTFVSYKNGVNVEEALKNQ